MSIVHNPYFCLRLTLTAKPFLLGYKGERKNKRNQVLPQFPFIYSYSTELSSHQFSIIYLFPILKTINIQIFCSHPLAII